MSTRKDGEQAIADLTQASASPPECPIHAQPLVTFCPRCRGQRGGQATSPRKRRAAQRNASKPRPRARKGKEQA